MISDSISPLDGRYRDKLSDVRDVFSEASLAKARCRVEIIHCLKLDPIFSPLSTSQIKGAYDVLDRFGAEDASRIKSIEAVVNHDVKAVELFLREKLDLDNPNRVHFGLTSEDVNNLAWSTLFKSFKDDLHTKKLTSLMKSLLVLCDEWKSSPFPARTHGQLATPTTAGKEVAVYLNRLSRPIKSIMDHRFHGKLNGATGTYAAVVAAAPNFDWMSHEKRVLEDLDLDRNIATTQIDDAASLCLYLDHVRTINNILVDLCQDIWMYISYGYLVQKIVKHEVGSSTMPHKVNPINFENAEGNLQLSNALLGFMTDKLSRSRMQRDLSGSTVMRNVGVALAHHCLALLQLQEGLGKVILNAELCIQELESHPELLSEALQTLLRMQSVDDIYDQVKTLIRGQDPRRLVDLLRKNEMDLTPSNYLGHSAKICDEVIIHVKSLLCLSAT